MGEINATGQIYWTGVYIHTVFTIYDTYAYIQYTVCMYINGIKYCMYTTHHMYCMYMYRYVWCVFNANCEYVHTDYTVHVYTVLYIVTSVISNTHYADKRHFRSLVFWSQKFYSYPVQTTCRIKCVVQAFSLGFNSFKYFSWCSEILR
jgi:hypothetical protein